MYTQMDNNVLSCPPLVDGVTCVHVESVRDPTNSYVTLVFYRSLI